MNFQTTPVKLYIQDIYRARRSGNNRYIYEIFSLSFKNVRIHGIVTAVTVKPLNYVNSTNITFEITDATGCVSVYFDSTKCNNFISTDTLKDLAHGFTTKLIAGDENLRVLRLMKNSVMNVKDKTMNLKEGDYVRVVGDIFLDDTNKRMIAAYECDKSSFKYDIVWLEELRYLYAKYYIPKT